MVLGAQERDRETVVALWDSMAKPIRRSDSVSSRERSIAVDVIVTETVKTTVATLYWHV